MGGGRGEGGGGEAFTLTCEGGGAMPPSPHSSATRQNHGDLALALAGNINGYYVAWKLLV